VLEPYLTKRCDVLEAQPLVKSDTRFIRESRAANGNVDAARAQDR
jgi:hypothetical protein